MPVESIQPFLSIAVSILGAAIICLLRDHRNLREGCSITTAVLKFLLVLSMLPAVSSGNTLHFTLLTFLPEVAIAFRVDALGMLFALVASFLWIVTTFYSIGYMRPELSGLLQKKPEGIPLSPLKEHAQTRYYACFAITLSATLGVAFAANLVTLYLFYEIMTFATYPLVAHKEMADDHAGAKKYLVYLIWTSKGFFLAAIVMTYVLSGTLTFRTGGLFPPGVSEKALVAVYFLFLFGIGKAAIMPFHAWLPAAMVAPTPVSALLHAVAIVNVGAFSVLRVIFHVFGVDLMRALNLGIATAFLVSFTIVMASIYALTRDNLKARLAYSTISQLSYIILGGALLSPSSVLGGMVHIANHAFSKITLFFCAGSIYVATHKTLISQMSGMGRRMPITMAAFSIGALSMIGVPPLSGFVTKWYLAIGSFEAGEFAFLGVLAVSTLLNAAYFIPILYKAYFEALPPEEEVFVGHVDKGIFQKRHEVSYFISIPLLMTAGISLILGIFPNLVLDLVRRVV